MTVTFDPHVLEGIKTGTEWTAGSWRAANEAQCREGVPLSTTEGLLRGSANISGCYVLRPIRQFDAVLIFLLSNFCGTSLAMILTFFLLNDFSCYVATLRIFLSRYLKQKLYICVHRWEIFLSWPIFFIIKWTARFSVNFYPKRNWKLCSFCVKTWHRNWYRDTWVFSLYELTNLNVPLIKPNEPFFVLQIVFLPKLVGWPLRKS